MYEGGHQGGYEGGYEDGYVVTWYMVKWSRDHVVQGRIGVGGRGWYVLGSYLNYILMQSCE